MPPARAYCSWAGSAANALSDLRSSTSRLVKSAKPSTWAKLLMTGLFTAGSAMRASAKAKSAAVDLPGPSPVALGREAGIGVEQDARADLEAVGLLAVGQRLGLGHRRGEAGDQLIGPLQVVILEQRVVDVAGDDVLGRGVGHGRIERLGRLVEGGIEHLLVPVGFRVGVVGAAERRQASCQRREHSHPCRRNHHATRTLQAFGAACDCLGARSGRVGPALHPHEP